VAERRSNRVLVGVVIGALAGSAMTAMLLARRPQAAPAAPPSFAVEGDGTIKLKANVPLHFETAPVQLSEPLPRVPVTARVVTVESRTSPSFAPLDGRVVEVPVRIGDRVKAKDKLVLVRSGDLAGMQRELRAAELSVHTKQALAERMKLLVESRAGSQNDLLVAQSELNEAKLAQGAASAKLNSLAVTESGETGYWVLANRAGTVVQLDATPGKQVGPDKDKPVATVADLDEVLVIGDVPQKDANTIPMGSEVRIEQPGSDALLATGAVETISDVLDPDRQTVPIRIRVKNEARTLRPNEFVEAAFAPSQSERTLQVPAEAIVSDGALSIVFVEGPPGSLHRRVVHVGRQTRERTELVSGVSEGERVVVRGALLLLNAVHVKE
jgi:cobalt-zinc-cadmium efflux system membrane fusion protein